MSSQRLSGLDLFRSVAIGLVLIYHASELAQNVPSWLKYLSSFGWAGVDLFFVLSGYLIAGQVFSETSSLNLKKSLRIFWIKRWYRTLPLYFFMIFMYMVLKPIAGFPFTDPDPWRFFFFLQNFFAPKDFVQSWSLCIEEQFYLVFPLLAYGLGIGKKHAWFWPLGLLGSLLYRVYLYQTHEILGQPEQHYLIGFPTMSHLDGIMLGVFLAATKERWWKFSKSNSLPLSLIGGLGFCFCLWWMKPVPLGVRGILSYSLLAIFGGIALMGALHLNFPGVWKKSLYWIATLSYGAYLWNNLFMRVLEKYFNHLHFIIVYLVFFILTFVAAYISYKLIELPFMKLRSIALKK